MSKELLKRITTSIILISLISLFLYLGSITILITLLVVSCVAYIEFTNLLIVSSKSSLRSVNILKNCFTIYYFFFIFFVSSFILTVSNIYDFIFSISICIFSDIGGYVVGKIIKGPKLTKISPNKTISGSLGSIYFSFIPLIVLNYFFPEIFFLTKTNLLFCIEISIICQLGDLFISFFKRKAKVKDTGKLLPGHGGLLDRIDGIIFALPYASYKLYGLENLYPSGIFKYIF